MAVEQLTSTDRGEHFSRYIEEMRAAWRAGEDASLPARAQVLLERLLAETPREEAWVAELLRDQPASRELYRDPERGFLQMGHWHKEGHHNAPHDHGPCWVLYGVYAGEIEITTYRRTDDGSVPDRARLEVKDVVRVTPGRVYPYLPGDIHHTRAIDPNGSVVMRFLSYDLDQIERYRYSLVDGKVIRV